MPNVPDSKLIYFCLLKGASFVNPQATNIVLLYFATTRLAHASHAKLAHVNQVQLSHANHVKTKNQLTLNCNSFSP